MIGQKGTTLASGKVKVQDSTSRIPVKITADQNHTNSIPHGPTWRTNETKVKKLM